MRRQQSTASSVKTPTEHEEQMLVVRWWRGCCREYDCEPEELFSIPNNGKRSFAVAQYFLDEGMVKGVADMFLAVPARGMSGMWIEMKRRKNSRVQPEQYDFGRRVIERGYHFVIAKGADDAITQIKEYLCGQSTD